MKPTRGKDTSMKRTKRKVDAQEKCSQDVDVVDKRHRGRFTDDEMLPTGEEGNSFKKGGLFIFDRFF